MPADACRESAESAAPIQPHGFLFKALVDWYRRTRRELPWRGLQADPYAVWVSEVMLQQTQVATVVPYYLRWMERFPTLQSLADAPLEEALRVWAGLGYYARARNLHAAARILSANGIGVPSSSAELAALPGIGRYTRGAILSIAFGKPEPILDANVVRVLSRVDTLDGDVKSRENLRRLWDEAASLVRSAASLGLSPGEFNQALMELGALVCTPADPACDRCPLLPVCRAARSDDPTRWPRLPAGKATVRETHASALVQRGGRWLVIQRPPHGLWGGLWEFPRRVCERGEDVRDCARRAARETAGVEVALHCELPPVKHTVTHHAITLHGWLGEATADSGVTCASYGARWIPVGEIGGLPLSAPQSELFRRLCDLANVPGH